MPQFRLDDYVQVNERLEKFRADHPTWGLASELIHNDGTYLIVRAVVTDENDRVVATGLAEEKRDSTPVNKTSPLENCETSAWGRALANLGYEVKRSIASREEMEKAARGAEAGGEAAAGDRTGAAAPPADPLQQRRVKMIGEVQGFIAEGTADWQNRREQILKKMAEAGIPNDFGAHNEKQLDAVGVILNDLQAPF